MAMMDAPILVGWDRTDLRREVSGTRETKLTACSDVNQSRYYVELRKDPITRHSLSIEACKDTSWRVKMGKHVR